MRTPVRLIVTLAALLAHDDARAAVTMVGDEEVVIQAHEVIEDDLLVYSPYVRMDGVVKGDLSVIGGDVVIDGIVEQDLLVVSKSLYLGGTVGDDTRALVYALALGENARVGDDLWSAVYSLEAKPGSRTGGSVYAAGRQALFAGQIVEDLRIRSGALALEGLTGGSVHAIVGGLEGVTHSSFVLDLALEIPELPDGVHVASTAAIGGDLDHRSPEPAVVSAEASIGGQVRHQPWRDAAIPSLAPADGPDFFADSGNDGLERLAVLLLAGLLLAVATPRFVAECSDRVRSRPVDLFGWGLGTVIFALLISGMLGVASLVLLALGLTTDLGGLALTAIFAGGLLQTALYALLLLALVYAGPVLASAGIGRALIDRIRPALGDPADQPLNAMLFVVVGACVYAGLRVVPWAGPIVGGVGALVGLGALARWLRDAQRPTASDPNDIRGR